MDVNINNIAIVAITVAATSTHAYLNLRAYICFN